MTQVSQVGSHEGGGPSTRARTTAPAAPTHLCEEYPEVLLTKPDNDIVNQWLDHLDEVQPADGRFTEDVLADAGKFPIDRPPGDAFDNRNDREKSYQYHRGTVARAYAREMATFRATMAAGEAAKVNSVGAEKYRLNSRYWSQIADWLDSII